MASASSDTNLIATRYAVSLLDMADDAGVSKKVESDMKDLAAMIDGSGDLRALLANPLISEAQKKAAILEIAKKARLDILTVNFLGVLTENGRLAILPSVVRAVKREVNRRRGDIEAHVQTAYALTKAQTEKLQKELTQQMGANVTLDVKVNKDLLGGMIVTVGSRMIDDSVRRKLERLGRAMSSGSNTNQQLKEVG